MGYGGESNLRFYSAYGQPRSSTGMSKFEEFTVVNS